MQLDQRFADQAELVAHLAGTRVVATGEQRPSLLGGLNALAGLGQHGRIVATQRGLVVVGRTVAVQAIGLAHGLQVLGGDTGRGLALGTEEQKVVKQRLGHLARSRRQLAELHEQPRRRSLHVDVEGQALYSRRLEESGGHTPKGALARFFHGG